MLSSNFKILIFLFSVLLIANIGKTQTLPTNMHYSDINHRLILSAKESNGFYNESKIESIYINFYDVDFWNQMSDNYDTEEYVLADVKIGNEVFDSVAISFKGNTSYKKAVEQSSEKLSISIKLDEVIENQEIEEYSNLNLNNSFGDASFMIEVLYAKLARKHIPAPRANFIHLYLNGEDWGLYPNVQQVNKDFIKEWFMNNDGICWRATQKSPTITTSVDDEPVTDRGARWGDGKSALNFYGTDTADYQPNYELKSSAINNPWNYLVETCAGLNNTPIDMLYDSIGNYINLDATLWFLATEIIFSDDDSYIYKGEMDYYLYYDEETKQMYPLEFDGNSAMKIKNYEWDLFYNEDNENYPLLNRLLQVPEIRQRYIAHVKTILNESFNEAYTNDIIDNIAVLIDEKIKSDPKSDNTYQNYSIAVRGLKRFITNRKNFILSNTEMAEEAPIISNVTLKVNDVEWANPMHDDEINITADVSHSNGLSNVYLYYGTQFFGNFQRVEMIHNGQNFSINLQGFNPGEYVRFYIEAIANNETQTRSYEPEGAEHDVYIFSVNVGETANPDLVINEFMAANSATFTDSNNEFDDWIELYNTSDDEILLDGYALSDNASDLYKWIFPEGTSIAPNGYLMVWADGDEEQEGLHTNFKLSASGEEVFLTNNAYQIINQVMYTSQSDDISYGRLPNGTGSFQEMNPTPLKSNSLVSNTIKNKISVNKLKIYPNPSCQYISVIYNNKEPELVEIYDITGKQILSESPINGIDISNLKTGFYIVKVENLTTPFIKQSCD